MIWVIAGIFVGLIAGMAFNMVLVTLSSSLYPMPEGVSYEDTQAFSEYIKTLPMAALFIIILAHSGQSLVGSLVACLISIKHRLFMALVIGHVSLAGGLWMIATVYHPEWMVLVDGLLYIPAALAGMGIASLIKPAEKN